MSVVETERFLRDAASLLPPAVRAELVLYLAANPEAGAAARVICYFDNEGIPLFLLAAHGKNEKANPTMAERNTMKPIVPLQEEADRVQR